MPIVKVADYYDFKNGSGYDWVVSERTSTTFVIEDDSLSQRQTFTGDFTYDLSGNMIGTVTATSYFIGDRFQFRITGISDDAAHVQSLVDTGVPYYLYDYLLRNSDRITGDDGLNRLSGFDGNDTISGGGSADDIRGGSGRDLLIGGAGIDRLLGGAGRDVFEFNHASETSATPGVADVVRDFKVGLDKLDLSGIDADGALAGEGSFSFTGLSAFSGDATGKLRYEMTGTAVVVYGSTDADTDPEFAITILNVGSLTESDFVL